MTQSQIFQDFVIKETNSTDNKYSHHENEWEGMVYVYYTTPDGEEEELLTSWRQLFLMLPS
jgi:hypothetical protein